MAQTVSIYVEDIDEKILTYESIRLYSDTSASGAFTTLVTTITLVADQTLYEYEHAAGDANTFYRYAFFHSTGPLLSALSAVMQPGALTLLRLRLEAARDGGAAFASTCSAVGTTTLLKDATLADSGVDAHFLEGAWIYRPDAAAAGDKLRRVDESGFVLSPDVGLTPNRAWTNAPANAEVYQLFNYAPPTDWPGTAFSWDRAVRLALSTTWYVDQVEVGVGTTAGKRRYSLSEYAAVERDNVRRVVLRRTDTNGNVTDEDQSVNQRFWGLIENGLDGLTLELSDAPGTDQTVIVEINRTYDELYLDTDVTTMPVRLAKAAVLYRFFEAMNKLNAGAYAGEEALWRRNYLREYRAPGNTVRGG